MDRVSPSNLEGENPVVDEQDLMVAEPVRYLRAISQYGVILCTEHRWAYTPLSLAEHLKRAHGAKGSLKRRILEWANAQNVAGTVSQPMHYGPSVSGLVDEPAWRCNVVHCMEISPSEPKMLRHCRQNHGLNSKAEVRLRGSLSKVRVQSWFAKTKNYFIVDPTLDPCTTPGSTLPYHSSTQSSALSGPTDDFESSQRSLQSFQARFVRAQDEARTKHQRVTEAAHTAELSPWQRLTNFNQHLADLEIRTVPASYCVPRREQDHPFLFFVGQSVKRVLFEAYGQISSLHHVEAKRLNTFQVGTVSQDPFDHLQAGQSLDYYSTNFVRLVCYFHRVHYEGHFEKTLFQPTAAQQDAHSEVTTAIEALQEFCSSCQPPSPVDNGEDADLLHAPVDAVVERNRLEQEIDRCSLNLCVALVEHRTPKGGFDSAILSYCAAVCRAGSGGGWLPEGRCSSLFSQLIYCCQLVILADARRQVAQGEHEDVDDALQVLCPRWIVNDSKGPVSDLSRFRLYSMKVGLTTVSQAPVRWERNGQTLHYQDITYQIRFVAEEVAFCLEQAQLIFRRDLCLGLPDIPVFNIADLSDNWDARAPGVSFLNDPRNAEILEGYDDWLRTGIAERPQLYSQIFQHHSVHPTEDMVRSDFAVQYEQSVQRFLEFLAMLLYKAAGQPARASEFVSLRWQNKDLAVRNLFVHDGYLLYVLQYHKSLHRTHASRYPVRFLLPGADQLLVQFLVLVQPIREFFRSEVSCPVEVSEHLWHNGQRIWDGARIRQVSERISLQAVGVRVGPRSWRQIAVSIAIKKFSGLSYQADLDLPGDEDDDLAGQSIWDAWGGAMADVFHQQAAHSVPTGNRAYGGTVNFGNGLTDAALQEYFRASRLWHQLCLPQGECGSRPKAQRRRRESDVAPWSADLPLLKRVALRQQPRRHRRHWGSETVHATLQRLFPEDRSAAFKTANQAKVIDCIAAGRAEIVAVLATGEGKSLSFMLPACLPHAAMTVVVVPLVVLKSDLIRRCQDANISFSVWDRQSDSDSQRHHGSPLLFVAVEQAVRQPFRRFLGQMDASEALDRVVFDEAHLILTARRYRPKMRLVKYLRSLRCQVVLLTATLPPLMQQQFQRCMLLAAPTYIRSLTFRRDVVYKCHVSSRNRNFLAYMTQRVQGLVDRLQNDANARVIVYTQIRTDADSLSSRLACPVYYSDSGEEDEKEAALRQWRTGGSTVMVATSAFGMGVDYAHVRAVIHMGVPRNMIDFAQEVGRLGRDGQGGTSYLILPYGWQAEEDICTELDYQLLSLPVVAMKTYVGGPRCLSATLSRFQDGHEQMQYCEDVISTKRCTMCEVHGLFHPGLEKDCTTYWDAPAGVGVSRGGESDLFSLDHSNSVGHEDSRTPGEAGSLTSEGEEDVEDPLCDVSQGAIQLRQHLREAERGRDRYERRLAICQGRCMICFLLGHPSGADAWHDFKSCRNASKYRFLDAKRGAIERGKRRGGWIPRYVSCTWCGNPQEVCVVDPELPPGPGQCVYPDTVFPTAWALFHQENRWGQSLAEISGQPRTVWEKEAKWMDWVGQECDLYGMRACEGVRMADWVMGQMEGERVAGDGQELGSIRE